MASSTATPSPPTLSNPGTTPSATSQSPSTTITPAPPPTGTTSLSTSQSSSSSSSSSISSSLPGTTIAPVVRPTSTNGLASTTSTGVGIFTQTSFSTKFVSSSGGLRPTSIANSSSSNKGFFSNTAAVAGVFSVVGLIGVAILLVVITNVIRRRRARKFDKELAEATLEAASAPKPAFLDDDDDEVDPYRNRGGPGSQGGYKTSGGFGGGFSEHSHGTYSQPPMSTTEHGGEAYGMREMMAVGGSASVKPGEIFDPYGAGAAGVGAAGAAGIGVARARSTNRADGGYAAGLQDGAAPYAAFAVPASKHDPYAAQHNVQVPLRGGGGRGDPNADILEAAGIGATVAGAAVLSRGQSQHNNAYNSQQYQPYPSQPQPQFGGAHQRSQSQLQLAQELEYANVNRGGNSRSSRESHGGGRGGGGQRQEYGPTPLSAASNATSNATQYFSPVAEPYQSQQYTQIPQGGQQQQYPQQPEDSVVEGDMDDAYGGYVADEHQGGPVGVALGGGPGAVAGSAAVAPGRRQSVLLNPFEAGSSSGHGKPEYDEDRSRESRYSDEEEAPKRVLKITNE